MILRSPTTKSCLACQKRHVALCKFDCGEITDDMLRTLLKLNQCEHSPKIGSGQ